MVSQPVINIGMKRHRRKSYDKKWKTTDKMTLFFLSFCFEMIDEAQNYFCCLFVCSEMGMKKEREKKKKEKRTKN